MGKRIVILGAGESGVGAALLSKSKGFDTFVSDQGKIREKYQDILDRHAIAYEENKHTVERILSADELIKSPGIPFSLPLVQQVLDKGIPVIDELEFAYRYAQANFIAVTGTNGKTTTTLLTYHLLREAGFNVGIAGNVGASLARQVAENRYDHYVVEVSSFQLEGWKTFRAGTAILLNITPDHLDRYGYALQPYIDAKFRVLQNMGKEDHFIYFEGDETVSGEIRKRKIVPEMVSVSLTAQKENKSAWLADNHLHFTMGGGLSVALDDLSLQGRHNAVNTMAAVSAALLSGADPGKIKTALKTFRNAAHRLEPAGKIKQVHYINDSKATNTDAAWYALDAIKRPILWIAGGVDKGNDYSVLLPLVTEKVKVLICLGKENNKLKQFFEGSVPLILEADNMQTAVSKAEELATAGDTVLLSPACASFDLFKNYEDRGVQFKAAVETLKKN